MGAVIGIMSGYLASDVLINANIRSYSVTGLVKAISLSSFLIGFFAPAIVFCIVTFVIYHYFGVKEAGSLITGIDYKLKFSSFTRLANSFTKILPIKNKFPIRIALRKPVSILLILVAVMGFTVMFVIGYSLTLSSDVVYTSQTKGHNYAYDTICSGYKIQNQNSSNALYYLYAPATVKKENNTRQIRQQIIGIQTNNKLLTLENREGLALGTPQEGTVYIGPVLHELYGFRVGDKVVIIMNNNSYTVKVADIAVNAKVNAIYMDKSELSQNLGFSDNTFNGVLSMKKLFGDGSVISREQKLEALERTMVSNKSSAMINQSIGCAIGCILIFLALLLNFQDNKKDILIMNSLGYRPKKINKMLIDIYKPIIWIIFIITLYPSIIIAQSVQRSLSVQMEDFFPFQINAFVIIFVFIVLNIVYGLVQTIFRLGIKRVIRKESIVW
jgi:putative ABC transport system permease protein